MSSWNHITIFGRKYTPEKQAEGIAVSQAVLQGRCERCSFLPQCSTDRAFNPPVFTWCARRKSAILADWRDEAAHTGPEPGKE